MFRRLWYILFLAIPASFGGTTCSQPACGGTIFQGTQRPLTPISNGSANMTSAGCSCDAGWGGTGCNVCQSQSACQTGFTKAGLSVSDSSSQNNTLVCNTAPRVWAAGHMSCQVNNPTLQALYPLSSTLNILRTLQPSLTPASNITSFGGSGSIQAQLFYAGVEQFYCQADSCAQNLGASDNNQVDWSCQNLRCVCRLVPASNLTGAINGLRGTLDISCGQLNNSTNTAPCNFKQATLQSLFGASGLGLDGCTFGECIQQGVIDAGGNTTSTTVAATGAGLATVGGLLLLALVLLLWGFRSQRVARRANADELGGHKVTVEWNDVSYCIPSTTRRFSWLKGGATASGSSNDDKIILDTISGRVAPGQMMAILGPSGAGKTTLIDILAGNAKSGITTGYVGWRSDDDRKYTPRIGFVSQDDVLPPTLTVFEALLFAARLRLPEYVTDVEKQERVNELLEKLAITHIRDSRIGAKHGQARGISGGEMRRVSIGLELIAKPDVLILDEPTSGLDSVSASRIAKVLHTIAHDSTNPVPVIASIHQPRQFQLYQTFDTVLLLAHGRPLYCGPGSFAPADYFSNQESGGVPKYQKGYNVADYLLEMQATHPSHALSHQPVRGIPRQTTAILSPQIACVATPLTQIQILSGREWKILRRDKTLFFTHVAVASVLGVFCGGLYFKTDLSIAGFQSRVGCLFFLGALIAFSSLSALYNIVEIRPLFLRERSGRYYSPTTWLLSRFIFDVLPLRIIPTIIVSTITYWMAGLAHEASNYFKFLFILVLYTLVMTIFNFLLGALFRNGGVAILLSALTGLYQMTFAGFFVHLDSIPPVLRWLQWLCPLKFTLEALSVNEVSSGLMIVDTLQGVPVNVSASLIMNTLFGFGANNYYRDVLVLFAYIAGFAVGVIGVVWLRVKERR
ncbi:ABC transporter [Infundibulicybe gibba]|nr:ABC transporter [Infundibulicybe gibba]